MQLKENTLFDARYRLMRLLGRGGFSEVWLAEDNKTGLTIALKVYAPGTGLDEDGTQLFSHEFALVFNLNHSNLLRPSHYDICDRMPYLIMPFCERGSAAKLMGSISEEKAWRFLHDVAAGLAFLHAQEPPVIHQDIKPDNVLIDAAGRYLITDFGISAKARSTLRKSVGNQSSGGGTIAYMAPERFGKDNTPIKASDVWALGATLFEMMTGDTPFGEHGGLIQKSGAEIPDIRENYPPCLREIAERCLAIGPWDRPTAETIVAWTEQHARGERIIFDRKAKPPPEKLKPEKPKPEPKPKPDKHKPQPTFDTPKRKSAAGRVLWIVGGAVAGLLLFFFVGGKFLTPDAEELERFENLKQLVYTNYEQAKTDNDTDFYTLALGYCNDALAIKKDNDLQDLKAEIERAIGQSDIQ
ncbi:MAG: serine/threonine protein kinase [Prevotellaceae bacterium]|jgi:serine/threonine protein kinase|nr:serine/threonine protein kinase [Prevotellaceae bacterium]